MKVVLTMGAGQSSYEEILTGEEKPELVFKRWHKEIVIN